VFRAKMPTHARQNKCETYHVTKSMHIVVKYNCAHVLHKCETYHVTNKHAYLCKNTHLHAPQSVQLAVHTTVTRASAATRPRAQARD